MYYRINTLTIRLPPVRALETYSWPGNVRQLFKSLVHATLRQSGGRIDAGDLPAEVTGNVRMPERHSPPQRHHDLAAWLSA